MKWGYVFEQKESLPSRNSKWLNMWDPIRHTQSHVSMGWPRYLDFNPEKRTRTLPRMETTPRWWGWKFGFPFWAVYNISMLTISLDRPTSYINSFSRRALRRTHGSWLLRPFHLIEQQMISDVPSVDHRWLLRRHLPVECQHGEATGGWVHVFLINWIFVREFR